MFGIDGSEFLIIIIVALVVVGPKDLPKLMRKVGQWAGKARAMADQFKRSFDDMARQSELDELRAEVNRLKHETTAQAEMEIETAMYPEGKPSDPLRNIEDVGAAPPKLEETAVPPASPQPAGAVEISPSPPPLPTTDTSAKLAETAISSSG